jgi:hypothetical protein
MIIPLSYNGNLINDGVDYAAWFISPVQGLPELTAHKAKRYGARPRIGGVEREGRTILLLVRALAGSRAWLRALFDGDDETPKLLVAADEDGGNQRYVKALCTKFEQTTQPGVFVATLEVDDDVRWRAVAPTVHNWTITASGQTTTITNGVVGVNDEAYPIIRGTPRQYMTGLNPYRMFLAVGWPADQPATEYPTDITDGGLDTRVASTDFYSATGADIRVIVDGEEVDFWLDGVNTATTSIWANLSWQARQEGTLASALTPLPVLGVTLNEDISNWPASGLVRIDNEVMAYGAKNSAARMLTGIERGARGSTAAPHSAGAAVQWLQHDIWVEYGSSSLAAKVVDNRRKPMFDLATSTNTSWNYLSFYEAGASRAGAWAFTNQQWTRAYGGNQKGTANPYGELGISDAAENEGTKKTLAGYWSLFNPCGMVSANFLSGERYYGRAEWWNASIQSSVDGASRTKHYTLPTGTVDAWVAWSQNVSLVAGARYVYLWLAGYAKGIDPARVEASQVTVALDSAKTPTALVLPQQNVYRMAATLTNQTTGAALQIDFALDVDETLRIDVDKSDAIYEADGSSQFGAITLVGTEQHRWLRLAPGANTLRWDEAGVTEMDVEITFERRYYA